MAAVRHESRSEMKPRAGPVDAAGRGDRRTIRRIYWWSLMVRAGAGLLAYVITQYFDIVVLEDALFYEEKGYWLATDWLAGNPASTSDLLGYSGSSAAVLIVMIAIVYYVLQGLRAAPILVFVYSAITALVPVYTYRLTRELTGSDPAAKAAAWLIALSPAFAFWSGSLHKEGLILLVLNVASYHALRLQKQWRLRSLLLVSVGVLALWGLRYYIAILLVAVLALGLLWGHRQAAAGTLRRGAPVFGRQVVIALGFVAVIFSVGFAERRDLVLVENERGVLVELEFRRQYQATSAASGYLPDARISTPDEAAEYLPRGLLYFLFVPFPWQFGSLRQNVAIPETLLWTFLYPLVAVGIVRGLRENRPGTVVLLAMTAGMCVFYALLSGNVGTAFRMRSQVWLLWAPFTAWGWEAWREWRRRPWRIASRAVRGSPPAGGR
jgi:hypothetical protein